MAWLTRWPSPDSISDEQAMREVQQRGDHDAFTALLRRWEEPIRRLCMRMTGDEHRGEDLTQEAFARVFSHRHQFQEGRKFSTWLWRIALNLCHEDARRMRISEPIGESSMIDLPGPDQQLIDRERCGLVRSALVALPESHRAIVVLREYEGMKFREIAEVLDTPEGTVKSRMAEALAELSRQLKPIVDPRPSPRTRAVKERLS